MKKIKVCIFSTCLVDLLFPKVGMAMVEVLERLGCETVLPEKQICSFSMRTPHPSTRFS